MGAHQAAPYRELYAGGRGAGTEDGGASAGAVADGERSATRYQIAGPHTWGGRGDKGGKGADVRHHPVSPGSLRPRSATARACIVSVCSSTGSRQHRASPPRLTYVRAVPPSRAVDTLEVGSEAL